MTTRKELVEALRVRYRSAAFLSAARAIGLAWLWTHEFCRQFSAELLMPGYRWWLQSMQVLVVGSFCSIALHYRETWQSWRSLCRTCQEHPTTVEEGG